MIHGEPHGTEFRNIPFAFYEIEIKVPHKEGTQIAPGTFHKYTKVTSMHYRHSLTMLLHINGLQTGTMLSFIEALSFILYSFDLKWGSLSIELITRLIMLSVNQAGNAFARRVDSLSYPWDET